LPFAGGPVEPPRAPERGTLHHWEGQYQGSLIMTYLTAGILPARQALDAPWRQPATSSLQRRGRIKDRGLRWAKSASRGRCGARPMLRHRASRRACPDEPICSHEMGHYQRTLV